MSYCSECSTMLDTDVCGDCGEPTDEICGVCNEILDNCNCEISEADYEYGEPGQEQQNTE